MILSNEALLEIVDIVREGLVKQIDISERLRELDLHFSPSEKQLSLSNEYLKKYPRAAPEE